MSTVLPDEIQRAYLIERFDDFLSLEQGSAERTREAYRRDVLRLAEYALTKSVRQPAGLTPRDLRDFVYHLKDVGLAPSSIRRTIAGLRTWFGFLVAEGVISGDPSDRLELPNRWQTLPEVLSQAEIARLIAAPAQDEPSEIHAVRHKQHKVWGVQFHPESVMTPHGKDLLANFLRLAAIAAAPVSA